MNLKIILPALLAFFALPHCPAADSQVSLGFADAARLAIAASDNLRNEYMRMRLREGAWTMGIRAYLPRFGISASEDDRLSLINADSFQKNYSVNIEQLIWDGGRLSMSRKIEKAELNLAAKGLDRTADEIGETAVSAYRDILYYRKVLEIRSNAVHSLEEQRRIMRHEFDLGMVLSVDLLAADITVADALIEITLLELDLHEAEQRLADLLGLDELPPLSETVDIYRSAVRLDTAMVRSAAESGNPDLAAAKVQIERRRIEARYAAFSWFPTIKLTGSFGLSGRQYPLTKFNWSVGIMVEFATPWISGSLGGSAGREAPYDRSARVQSSLNPAPEPASSFTIKNASLNLIQEQANYETAFRQTGRMAAQAVEKYALLDQKRSLAVQIMELETERYRLAELKLELGRLTRVELMEARLSCAEREIAAVKAAISMLEAERELENFLSLAPGELKYFSGLREDRR